MIRRTCGMPTASCGTLPKPAPARNTNTTTRRLQHATVRWYYYGLPCVRAGISPVWKLDSSWQSISRHGNTMRWVAGTVPPQPTTTKNDDDDHNDTIDTNQKHHDKTSINTLYLHVGPSGDCWTGDSIFAAKHLQPDYVKSIPLLWPSSRIHLMDEANCNDDLQETNIENLLQVLEDDPELAMGIYDTESIPSDLLERIISLERR